MKLQRLTCSVILLIRSIYINSVNCERIKADALDDAVAAAQNAIDAANTAQQIAIQATEFAIEATNNATEIAVLAAAGAAGSYAATAAFEAIDENTALLLYNAVLLGAQAGAQSPYARDVGVDSNVAAVNAKSAADNASQAAANAANGSHAITALLLQNPGKWPLKIVNAEAVAARALAVAVSTSTAGLGADAAYMTATIAGSAAIAAADSEEAAANAAPRE